MRYILALAFGLLATGAFARCADMAQGFEDVVPKRSDTLINVGQDFDTILERGVLSFAVYEDFAPYSWQEEGQPLGVNIDIARMLADEIGVTATFNFFRADENVDADLRNHIWKGPLIGGNVSNVMMHVPYSKDFQCRNEFVVLGGQYFTDRLATAYRRAAFPDGAPTTPYFRFHKVGVENHTISAFYLENFHGGILLPNLVHYPSHAAAFAGMEAGDVDAVMGPRGIMEYLDQSDDFAVGTPPLVNFSLDQWALGIAVNFRYRELFYTIDGIIADMVRDGRMQSVFEKYAISWTPPQY